MTADNILVSIIIPAYNTENYIFRAIESSIRQTHKNIEIIIVDDGSTDGTTKVARGYAEKDSRVKIFHQENKGVSAARNHGIREAQGEYFVFLDSDDWLEDNAVEFLLNEQLKYPDKLITIIPFGAKLREDGTIYKIKQETNIKQTVIIDDSEQAILSGGNLYLQSACYKPFKAEILRNNNIFFHEDVYNREDGLFVFEYLHEVNGLVFIPAALWNVLARPGSTCRGGYKRSMTQSVIKADTFMMNHPKNSPELKEFCTVNFAGTIAGSIASTKKYEHGKQLKEDLIYLKKLLKQYQHFYLSAKRITLTQKIKFLIKSYMPVLVVKFMLNLKDKILPPSEF